MPLIFTSRSRPQVQFNEALAEKDHASHRRRPTLFERWPGYIAITLAGIGGFVGLLVASNAFPEFAKPLRIAALIWFAWFGVIRLATVRNP